MIYYKGMLGFPSGSAGKDCLQCRRPGFDPWVGKIPWRRERLPIPVFWPGEFHALYSPRGCKEADTTERLSLAYLDLSGERHYCLWADLGVDMKDRGYGKSRDRPSEAGLRTSWWHSGTESAC